MDLVSMTRAIKTDKRKEQHRPQQKNTKTKTRQDKTSCLFEQLCNEWLPYSAEIIIRRS